MKIVLTWPIENKNQLEGNLEVISVMIYKKLLAVISHREQDWEMMGSGLFHILSSQFKVDLVWRRELFLEKEHQAGKNKE